MFDAGVNLFSLKSTPEAVIEQAKASGVNGCLIIASNLAESYRSKEFCEQYDSAEFALRFTVGVHPHHASEWSNEHYQALKTLAQDKRCVAIGECGLDFNRNFSSPKEQEHAFVQQLQLATHLQCGVYLHERDAFEMQIELLEAYGQGAAWRFAHCFTGSKAQALGYLALDCYIGITGWICDPQRGESLRDSCKVIPLERLLFETDAPYLFPKTLKPRAKENAPQFLPHIIAKTSEIMNEQADKLISVSTQNAARLFKLG